MFSYLKKTVRFTGAALKEKLLGQPQAVGMVRLGVNPNSSSLGMSALLLMYGVLAVGILAPVVSVVARLAVAGKRRGEVAVKGSGEPPEKPGS